MAKLSLYTYRPRSQSLHEMLDNTIKNENNLYRNIINENLTEQRKHKIRRKVARKIINENSDFWKPKRR